MLSTPLPANSYKTLMDLHSTGIATMAFIPCYSHTRTELLLFVRRRILQILYGPRERPSRARL